MIRFINNLHYGKLNPGYTEKLLDARSNDGLKAEIILLRAIKAKDLIAGIEQVQPRSDLYRDLQRQLHMMAGVYVGDCYDIPEASIRQVAVNMERLRWMPVKGETYIEVNIPSFTVRFHQPNADLSYRVVVGKRETPTIVSQGMLTGITLGEPLPDIRRWLPSVLNDIRYIEKHGYQLTDLDGRRIEPTRANIAIAKKDPSKYRLTIPDAAPNAVRQINFELTDMPHTILAGLSEGSLFKKADLALSRGAIRVEAAGDLAGALLAYDSGERTVTDLRKAVIAKQHRHYTLKKPIPVYVTYLTCDTKQGLLSTYADVYHLDEKLAWSLFKGAIMAEPYRSLH